MLQGPCEIWLGNTLVFHDDNCAGNYPSKPKAELKVNYSECKGEKCVLQFYWLALHEPTWQIYSEYLVLLLTAVLTRVVSGGLETLGDSSLEREGGG